MEPMYALIKDFPDQLLRASALCKHWTFEKIERPKGVVICGMGGSGIAGKIVSSAFADQLSVPVTVVQDYQLPEFCSQESLVIVSSYSGNTEESISCFLDAVQRGCRPVCISSGGKLLDLCLKYQCPCLTIPGGFPPRSQFGYGFIGILHILSSYGLITKGAPDSVDEYAKKLLAMQVEISAAAAELAEKLKDKIVCMYAEVRYAMVALRWRQQLNENSKMLCLCEAVPEMNHNELVGWGAANSTYAAVLIHSSPMHPRIKKRFEILQGVLTARTPYVLDVQCPSGSPLFTVLYLVHFGDWLSWHLAEQRGFDPVAIPQIDYLKEEMGR
jgi:glucose/mannose-6-phosphate isomerase